MGRYDRQEVLDQIGVRGQLRLGKSRVLVVGCGALGSVSAEYLARAGVGFLRIVDRDLVELANLQRQTLFDEQDAAEQIPKAAAAARRLAEINHEIKIEPIVADANAGNVEGWADVDVIVDGTDNVATRYLLNDVAVKHKIPWVYGGCVGVEGRVWGIWPGKTACLQCLFPQPPSSAEMATCDTAGVLGPAAGIVGAMQAAIAIRFLVEGSPKEANESGMICLDAWTASFRRMESAARPREDCLCCGAGNFRFLSTKAEDFTTNLCGRRAVQVVRYESAQPIDLSATARRWEKLGTVGESAWFVKCRLHEPAGIDLTLFADGRLIVHGTNEPMRAKSLYARFVGS